MNLTLGEPAFGDEMSSDPQQLMISLTRQVTNLIWQPVGSMVYLYDLWHILEEASADET